MTTIEKIIKIINRSKTTTEVVNRIKDEIGLDVSLHQEPLDITNMFLKLSIGEMLKALVKEFALSLDYNIDSKIKIMIRNEFLQVSENILQDKNGNLYYDTIPCRRWIDIYEDDNHNLKIKVGDKNVTKRFSKVNTVKKLINLLEDLYQKGYGKYRLDITTEILEDLGNEDYKYRRIPVNKKMFKVLVTKPFYKVKKELVWKDNPIRRFTPPKAKKTKRRVK